MNRSLPIDETFGNYSVHGIEEIVPAALISWTPATPAWNFLFVALLIVMFLLLYKYFKRWKTNAYRRQALRRIQELRRLEQRTKPGASTASESSRSALLRELPSLMKSAALCAFPRTRAAALTGEPWLQFLDRSYSGPSFQNAIGHALLRVSYSDEQSWNIDSQTANQLISQCELWLTKHRADKNNSQLSNAQHA